MQFLKKFILLGFFLLSACQMPFEQNTMAPLSNSDFKDQDIPYLASSAKKVGVLLPLSGKNQNIGQNFKNAAPMALFDRNTKNIQLLFFDTKGTSLGANQAFKEANSYTDIIVGPIFAEEVKGIKTNFLSSPILSFTSNTDYVGDGIYTSALLIPEQMKKIASFLCQKGRTRIGVIGPENKMGELSMNALDEALKECPDMHITKTYLYANNTTDFTEGILKMLPKIVDEKKKNLSPEEKRLLNMPVAKRADFDSLIILEDGLKTGQIMAALPVYDIGPEDLMIIGFSSWNNKLNEQSYNKAYFVAMPNESYHIYASRYQEFFGKKPISSSILAYDTISLLSILADSNQLSKADIENINGFLGLGGLFRFLPNGTNERALAVYQIKNKEAVLVQEALQEF